MQITHQINQMEFPTLEAAWEGINEYLANNEREIIKKGGGCYGTEMVSYDNFIYIYKSWISPDFNFGHILGYKYKKWSKLINNYVDQNYLDLVKGEVLDRERKKSLNYNYTMHFANSHGSGKDCLISLSFCKRKGNKNPFVIYTTRASECTSRMIFDFLLIQRICEYVYGKGVTVEVACYIPFMFINIERFLMYMGYKGRDILKPTKLEPNRQNSPEEYSNFQKKCIVKYDHYMAVNPKDIKYKVHRRAALQIQKDANSKPIANAPDLLAKDLTYPFNKKLKVKDIDKLNKSQSI
mgnify:CR=1 FL=1